MVAYITRLHIPSPHFYGAFLPVANSKPCKNEI